MKRIKKLHKKYTKNFIKYVIVGFLLTVIYVFLMWLFIDISKIPTIISASLVSFGLFFLRYYLYVIIGMIHGEFYKYAVTSISYTLAAIFFIWLFIDIFHINTIISSAIVVYATFILKFLTFDRVGLLKSKSYI